MDVDMQTLEAYKRKCFLKCVWSVCKWAEVRMCNSAVLYFVAGKGAMAEVSTIVSVVKQYLQEPDECTSHHIVDTSDTRDK